MPSLIVTSGTLAGQIFSFSDTAVIGRGQYSDVRLNDATVSRRHAMICRNGNSFELRDQNSANGTLLRGKRIDESVPLRDGDELQFGEVKAVYRSAASERPSQPAMAPVTDNATGSRAVLPAKSAGADRSGSAGGLRDLLARLKLCSDLGHLAQSRQDLRERLDRALAAIHEAFPQTSTIAVYSCVAGTEQLNCLARRDNPSDSLEFGRIEAFLNDAMRREHGLSVTDASARDALAARLHAELVPAALLGVPLRLSGEVLGALYIDSAYADQAWRAADQDLFLTVAGQLSWMLGAAQTQSPERAIEAHDLALARRIQQRFLPQSPPALRGYRFADCYSAARVIGGDYYDFFNFADGRQGMVIADVSGKAVSGALYMARLSVQVGQLARGLSGPQELLMLLNRQLAEELEPGMFVTMLAVAIRPESGELTIANAGHPAPLQRLRDGTVHELGEEGALPLGAMADTTFQQSTTTLAKGCCVLFYTDGLDEAHDVNKTLFGKSRIVRTLAEAGADAQVALDALLADLAQFTAGEPQSDDLTLITLSRNTGR